jgi:hypothetical protein
MQHFTHATAVVIVCHSHGAWQTRKSQSAAWIGTRTGRRRLPTSIRKMNGWDLRHLIENAPGASKSQQFIRSRKEWLRTAFRLTSNAATTRRNMHPATRLTQPRLLTTSAHLVKSMQQIQKQTITRNRVRDHVFFFGVLQLVRFCTRPFLRLKSKENPDLALPGITMGGGRRVFPYKSYDDA